jgi:hypothetical protein
MSILQNGPKLCVFRGRKSINLLAKRPRLQVVLNDQSHFLAVGARSQLMRCRGFNALGGVIKGLKFVVFHVINLLYYLALISFYRFHYESICVVLWAVWRLPRFVRVYGRA